MLRHSIKLLTGNLLAGGVVLALSAGAALAQAENKNALFCEAIGLAGIEQQRCADQLDDARDPAKREAVMTTWVRRSPIGTKATMYSPPTDGNQLNGRPGTPYAGKKLFLPNEVVADIQRVARKAGRDWQ